MELTVVLEQRYLRTPDGMVYARPGEGGAFFERYLEVFERVRVVARAHDVERVGDADPVIRGRVSFSPVPLYVGALQLLIRRRAVREAIRGAVRTSEALLLRVPGPLGAFAWRAARGRPYGLEVVGDPWEVYGVRVGGLAGWALRREARRVQERQCREAAVAAYVTREALQRRYPPGRRTFGTSYSSIELDPTAFRAMPREFSVRGAASSA